jgi:hypothetical protein
LWAKFHQMGKNKLNFLKKVILGLFVAKFWKKHFCYLHHDDSPISSWEVRHRLFIFKFMNVWKNTNFDYHLQVEPFFV